MKQITKAAMLLVGALALPGASFGHAVSIGYENAGVAGAVTIWLGTYSTGHAAITNEGSMKLEGALATVFGPVTTAFNLLAGPGVAFKPAGLVDGLTNFYAPNGTVGPPDNSLPLVSSEAPFYAACSACGPVDRWQGVTFSGLSAGDYQFTWIPIASPTLQWDILNLNMNGIFRISEEVVNPTPEPVSLALLAVGLGALGFSRRKKAKVTS